MFLVRAQCTSQTLYVLEKSRLVSVHDVALTLQKKIHVKIMETSSITKLLEMFRVQTEASEAQSLEEI